MEVSNQPVFAKKQSENKNARFPSNGISGHKQNRRLSTPLNLLSEGKLANLRLLFEQDYLNFFI
jgi:hypothetical protein